MSDATFEKTLTLGDAIRLSGPMAFNIMIKPAGSLCNLDCKYCYYLDKAEIYGGKEPRMTEAMLEKVVQEYISANGVPEVTFNWHGGEPLVLGLDFYRKALEFEKKYACERSSTTPSRPTARSSTGNGRGSSARTTFLWEYLWTAPRIFMTNTVRTRADSRLSTG